MGTAYIPPNTQDSLSNLIHSLDLANKHHIDNLLDRVVFIGDCNARHVAWGDTVTNAHGINLHDHLVPDYKINNDSGPTFLSSNGSSVIDLILVSGQVTNLVNRNFVSEDVELFTGAPNRGHVPINLEIDTFAVHHTSTKKPWIERANWDERKFFLK